MNDHKILENYLEDLFYCVINEFGLKIEMPPISEKYKEVFYKIIEEIGTKYKGKNDHRILYNHFESIEVILNELYSPQRVLFSRISQNDLDGFTEEYSSINTQFSGKKYPLAINTRFSLVNKDYKKYLRRSKDQLLFQYFTKRYDEDSTQWKSVNDAISQSLRPLLNSFIEFDISWIKSEIIKNKDFTLNIESHPQFREEEESWIQKEKPQRHKETVLFRSVIETINHQKIQISKKNKQQELKVLETLLAELKHKHPDYNKLCKEIPYYGDSLEDLLRKELKLNEKLCKKIIRPKNK